MIERKVADEARKSTMLTFKTLNGSGPRYLEDILKFYHQARTLRSSRDHLRLEEPNFNMKTYGQRAFSVAAPDYGTSSPLKFELVLMLIFLNLSWKRFFLKRYMTFSFVIFVFVFDFVLFCFVFVLFFLFFSFLFKMCTVGLYVSFCLMIFLCPFFTS